MEVTRLIHSVGTELNVAQKHISELVEVIEKSFPDSIKENTAGVYENVGMVLWNKKNPRYHRVSRYQEAMVKRIQ